MEIGYTYATPGGDRVMVYAPPEFEVASTMPVRRAGTVITCHRLSDRDLFCGKAPGVTGECDNQECHRKVLGECQCGRHEAPVPFRAAGA